MKILGHTYSATLMGRGLIGPHLDGYTSAVDQTILVSENLKETDRDQVLIHEVIEALNYRLELEMPHAKITALAEGIYSVLHDNGMKTDWLKIFRNKQKNA